VPNQWASTRICWDLALCAPADLGRSQLDGAINDNGNRSLSFVGSAAPEAIAVVPAMPAWPSS
jgi:hypothetical protein